MNGTSCVSNWLARVARKDVQGRADRWSSLQQILHWFFHHEFDLTRVDTTDEESMQPTDRNVVRRLLDHGWPPGILATGLQPWEMRKSTQRMIEY